MTSKFSHRRTRVQHTPKVCKSERPRPSPAPPIGHRMEYSFDVVLALPFQNLHYTGHGTILGILGSDQYRAISFFNEGPDYVLTITWPQTPGLGSIYLTSQQLQEVWEQTALPGWFTLPTPPTIDSLHGTAWPGQGTITMTLSP